MSSNRKSIEVNENINSVYITIYKKSKEDLKVNNQIIDYYIIRVFMI